MAPLVTGAVASRVGVAGLGLQQQLNEVAVGVSAVGFCFA